MQPCDEEIVPAFLRAAERDPAAPAILWNGQVTTYRELAGQARALAALLCAEGVAGAPVAVPAVRGSRVVAAFFGTLMAGGAYCPVDPGLPADRREAMIRAAGCVASLEWGPAAVSVAGVRSIRVPDDATAVAELPAPQPEDTAYILFTSGSTGLPKPVDVPHRAIAASVGSLVRLFGAGRSDRFLQFASLNWDTCFEEILPALTTGATLVLDDDAHSGSFSRLLDMLGRTRTSVLNLPTAYWHELVLHLVDFDVPLPDSLRLVVIGGEGANPDRLADWRRCKTGDVRLVNTYGCTETALVTHAVDLAGPLAGSAATALGEAPIGRPMPHVRQLLQPHGPADQLYVGGPSLANGYRGDPATTAQRFVVLGGERYFRTGDLVQDVGDGLLAFRGRADRQLKIRGVRIDPAEVEVEVVRHTGVPGAAVIGVPMAGRTALVAFVVGDPHGDAADRMLRRLRDALPAHLVPARLVVRADLPRTASGKTDYTRLTKEWNER